MPRLLALFLAALAVLFAPSALAQTCSTEWTGAVGDDFDEPGNWTNGPPMIGSVGCIIAPGTYSVSIVDNTLSTGGPDIQGYGVVVVGGEGAGRQTLALINQQGNAAGPPEVLFEQLLIRPNGELALYAGSLHDTPIVNEGLFRFIHGPIAYLFGTTTLTNTTGTVQFDQSFNAGVQGRLVNEAGGTIRLVGPAARFGGKVLNRGLITSTAGSGSDYNLIGDVNGPEIGFVNDGGRVEVLDGELRVSTDGMHRLAGGTYEAADGARLLLSASGNELEGTLGGAPAGTVEFAPGASGVTSTGAGATLAFGGTGLRWTRNSVRGTWRNTGRLIVAGTGAGINSGTFTNAGRFEVEAVSMSALGAGTLFLNDTQGVVAFTGTSTSVSAGQGAQLVNRGRVVAETGPAFWTASDAPAGTPGVLLDGGRLEATGGDLTVSVTGLARYQGGTYVAAAGRTLTLASSSGEADGTLTGEGEGLFVLYFQDSPTQRPEDEGVLAFGGQGLRLDNTAFTGAWRNTGRVVHRYGIRFQDATFVNEGTAVWPDHHVFQGTTTYVNEAGARIEMVRTGGAGGDPATTSLVNRGTMVLLPGTDGYAQAGFGALVTNAAGGEIRAEAGTIFLNNPADEAGARYTGVGTFQAPAGFTIAGTIAPGNAPGEAGTLTWNRPFAAGPTFVLEVDVNGPDAGTGYDRLAVGGAVTLDGTAVLRQGPGYFPAVGTTFPGVLTAPSVTGTFATETLAQGFSLVVGATAVDAVVTSPVGVEDGPGDAPEALAFGVAALSNPSAQPTVRVTMPEAMALAVDVFDVQGRRVARLADESRAAGVHALPVSGLAPGTYVARVVAVGPTGTERATQRLVVVR